MTAIDYLFSSSDLRTDLANHEAQAMLRIDRIDADEFLKASPEDLVDELVNDFLVDIPELHTGQDDISVHQREVQRDLPTRHRTFDIGPIHATGTEFIFHVPFDGDANLFRCTASTRSYSPPQATVGEGELIFRYMHTATPTSASLQTKFQNDLSRTQQNLYWIGSDVEPFNNSLPEKIRKKIDSRREKLLADRGTLGSLGYRLRERDNSARTYAVPARRRTPPVRRARPKSTDPFKPEPALPDEDYERILEILSNMVGVMESSPRSFKTMKEEDLRQHFLLQLNGQYLGGATGETFNYEGKTDILVKVEGKTIFIAECKFWKGPKSLTDAIDQLLGYASWRDTKTAILLFNRAKNLSGGVLAKIPGAVKAHPNFKREAAIDGETAFRYTFGHRDDLDRELTVTVLVFEVPV
jgi:hypothetical protein